MAMKYRSLLDTTASCLRTDSNMCDLLWTTGESEACKFQWNLPTEQHGVTLQKIIMFTEHTTFFIIRPTRCTNFTNFIFGMKPYMFRTVPLSIIRSAFTVHSAVVYVIQVCRQLLSRSICSFLKAVYKPVWHIPLLSVQWMHSWWWTEALSKTCRASYQK